MRQLLYRIDGKEAFERALACIQGEATSAGSRSVLIHLFCGDVQGKGDLCDETALEWAVERMASEVPQAQIVGVSSGGEIQRSKMLEPCMLVSAFLFDSSWVEVLSFRDVIGHEKEIGARLLEEVQRRNEVKGVELLFAGTGIGSAQIYGRMQECQSRLPFFGGYAVDHDSGRKPAFLLVSDGVLREGMAAVIYGGDELHVNPGRTTGWKPLGNPFRVTEAEGRRLISVNGIAAYDFYNQLLKIPEGESFTEYTKEFPLMLLKGKMRLLRHPQERFEDSSILLDGPVRVGDAICISYGAPIEIVRKMNQRCEKIRAFEPEAVLLYSCRGRKNYWGDLIDWEMEPFQKVAETGGACLDGQVMRNNQTGRVLEHRLTLLSIALREGEKTGHTVAELEVDDEILKGRMSVMHRMSTLIESTVERLQRANEELHRAAMTDELTGLFNRREIEHRIKTALDEARRDRGIIALVMLDIDYFKKVNDVFGHDVGDVVLKGVASILAEQVDEARFEAVGRWGGEEFLVLLPNKGIDEAVMRAEKIRTAVESCEFSVAGHRTVSLGVTCASADSDYQAMFIRADQALYQAKQGGRNRTVALGEHEGTPGDKTNL